MVCGPLEPRAGERCEDPTGIDTTRGAVRVHLQPKTELHIKKANRGLKHCEQSTNGSERSAPAGVIEVTGERPPNAGQLLRPS